jgi:hypothetical protein
MTRRGDIVDTRLGVVTIVKLHIVAFWFMTTRILKKKYQSFGDIYYLYFQGRCCLNPEDHSIKFD